MSGSEVQPIRSLAAIPLHLIKTERNVREQLPGIIELAESIRLLGVLQPVTVQRRNEGGFTLVFGHRRLAACKLAGRASVPALIVGDYTADDRIARQMAENTGRAPLDPIEEARGFKAMRDRGTTVPAIARICGISPATVYTRLALLELPPTDQIRLRRGEVTLGQAQEVAKLVKTRTTGTVRHSAKAPGTLTRAHPLAYTVLARCEHHDGRTIYGGVGCGPCWETTIRADERARPRDPS